MRESDSDGIIDEKYEGVGALAAKYGKDFCDLVKHLRGPQYPVPGKKRRPGFIDHVACPLLLEIVRHHRLGAKRLRDDSIDHQPYVNVVIR